MPAALVLTAPDLSSQVTLPVPSLPQQVGPADSGAEQGATSTGPGRVHAKQAIVGRA